MKTLYGFDYDLWAIKENDTKRFFARVKATGEESEVSIDVMRLLLSQEKQMRREYAKQQIHGTILSLDAICDNEEIDEATWLVDKSQNVESDVLAELIQSEFVRLLTPHQAEIFQLCVRNGKGIREVAAEKGISHVAVCSAIAAIRKKYKKYFF